MKQLVAIEWNPIRIEKGEYVGNLPDIDDNDGNDEFLVTYKLDKHRYYTKTDLWNDNHNWFESFNVVGDDIEYGIIAWANFPKPYYKNAN